MQGPTEGVAVRAGVVGHHSRVPAGRSDAEGDRPGTEAVRSGEEVTG